jgi:predicted 3-demethylubiquinone-9 3-methyltransferase (glyoxalase superfamily)
VTCKDQEEIDYYWQRLSHTPDSEQCGWCKDRFGMSWQIIPENMGDLLAKGPEAVQTMMKQKKIVIAEY